MPLHTQGLNVKIEPELSLRVATWVVATCVRRGGITHGNCKGNIW